MKSSTNTNNKATNTHNKTTSKKKETIDIRLHIPIHLRKDGRNEI